MTELNDLPARASGRVGMCRNSINDALKKGFTLRECAARLDLEYLTFWRAWKAQKIVVPDEQQVALPAPVREAVKQATKAKAKAAVPAAQAAPGGQQPPRPLPGKIPVGDAEAIVDAVEAKLGANFFK